MTETRKQPKCPWPKPHMRDVVKRAMDKVGGQRGFDFLGRGMQEAIIDQAVFHICMAASSTPVSVSPTFDEMVGARRVAYQIAGIWDDE